MKSLLNLFFLLIFSLELMGQSEVYVSPEGNDSNDGSFENPLRTIQQASEVMDENGICYIREGVYRETVNVTRSNQTFTNYNGEYVIVTGLNSLSGWRQYKDGIYQTSFDDFETEYTQLFMNGIYQQMARYPNQTTDEMLDVSFKSGYDTCVTYSAKREENTRRVTFPNMREVEDNYWQGDYFRGITGHKWMNPHGSIVSNEGKNLMVDPVLRGWQNNNPKADGSGYSFIFHLNALDVAGEWYAQNGKIFFKPPKGYNPEELNMEARKREWAFRINEKDGIKLKGLHIKAASIELIGSDCIVDSCTIRYLFPFFTRKSYGATFHKQGGIYINGDDNIFKKCYIAHSWGHGFSLESGTGNRFQNCIIEDIGWNAEFTCSIYTHGRNTTIRRCTFGPAGRFHIRLRNKTKILYNDLYDCMNVGQDAGSIEATSGGAYATVLDVNDSEIAYNYIHDSNTLPSDKYNKQFVVAIYLEDVANYTAHHNVIWNFKTDVYQDGAFVYLGPRRTTIYDVNYFNNTAWNCDKSIFIWNRDNMGGIKTTRFVNNILDQRMKPDDSDLLQSIEFTHNIFASNAGKLFEKSQEARFYLKENSPAIDAGKEIGGITDNFVGNAPDAGAYEYGKELWTAGSTMDIPEFIEKHPVGSDDQKMTNKSGTQIKVYPNPVTGNFLYVKSTKKGEDNLLRHDVKGKMIYQKKFHEKSLVIPLKQMIPSRMYLVSLHDEKELKTRRLIIR